MFTIKVKGKMKISANHINKIASAIVDSLSDSDRSVSIMRKKKARLGAGVLCSNRGTKSKEPKNPGIQCHCMIYRKAGIPEREYMSQSDEDCFGKCSDQKPIKDGLGSPMGSRAEAVKQWNK